MDVGNKAKTLLAEDLEVSSSEDEMNKSLPMNEGDLSSLSGDEMGSPEASSNIFNFNLSTGATGLPKAEENIVKLVKEGPARDTEDGDDDSDEICRKRNIQAPPRGYGHRFQRDSQFAGTSKEFNIDARENESLDEIIRRIPTVGFGRDRQTIRRRRSSDASEPHAAEQRRNEKLRLGLHQIIEPHPELANTTLKPSEQTSEGYAEFRDEPWQCIMTLVSRGFSIYYSVSKLKNQENLDEENKSRLYRFLVRYGEIEGICEASNEEQAKQGAAVDLLGKLSKEYPNLGPFPEKVNEAFLIKESALSSLLRKMKERHGGKWQFRFEPINDKVNNHTLSRVVLFIGTCKYEGSSYLSARAARSVAIKVAYEDLLNEDCPMDTIHLGVEQCTKDLSLYRVAVTHMIHCYDFSRSVVVDPKTEVATGQVKKNGRATLPRRDKCVPVCYLKPEAGPKS